MTPHGRSPLWHPFTQHALEGAMLPIARADGAWLTTTDGQRIFDGICSWWVITHGHCHPKIVSAIQEQAARLDQVIFAGFTHEPAERVASVLLALAPEGLAHVFFSDSGSTSVEVALKMALGYWRNVGDTKRNRILALQHAYHGDTIGTMSAGARGVFNAAYGSDVTVKRQSPDRKFWPWLRGSAEPAEIPQATWEGYSATLSDCQGYELASLGTLLTDDKMASISRTNFRHPKRVL